MENEMVNQLKEEVTAYGKSVQRVGELRLVGVVSRIIGLFLLIFTIVLLVFALLSFGAVAIIAALANHMPIWAAALIMGGLYLVMIVVIIACRKQLFINPFILLMTKQIKTEEELNLKTVEAEHKMELNRVRIGGRVDDVTRKLDFYAGLATHIWNFLTSWLHKKKA